MCVDTASAEDAIRYVAPRPTTAPPLTLWLGYAMAKRCGSLKVDAAISGRQLSRSNQDFCDLARIGDLEPGTPLERLDSTAW